MAAIFMTDRNDPTAGHIGGPTCSTAFKLKDVPEMNYTHKDMDEQGNPLPRGELCIKSTGNLIAYYKNEKATKETITPDGFVLTGDIGIIIPSLGIKLIDRRKNLFKLA